MKGKHLDNALHSFLKDKTEFCIMLAETKLVTFLHEYR